MQNRVVFLLLCLGNITISFNVAAITAAVPVISLSLGLPDFLVSKIIPYYLIPYGFGALLYAPLTRYLNYRTVLGVSMVMLAISCFVCGQSSSLNQILIARIVMGITAASAIPLGLMIIGELFERDVRGRLVGVFFSCSFFSSLVGIALSGIANWRWLFYVPAILGFALVVCLIILKVDLLNRKHEAPVNYIKALNNQKIRSVFIFIFAISFLYHGVHKWFGVYLNRIYDLDKLSISFFFIVMAVAGLCGQLLGGVLSDKKGRLVSCYVGIVGLAASTMFLISTYSLIVLGLILGIISMCWTIGHNGVSTVLTDFHDQDRPIIASLNSSIRFISGGLGFYVSSLFVEKSFSLTFFCIGILMIVVALSIPKLVKAAAVK